MLLLLAAIASAESRVYELSGRIEPRLDEGFEASVTIYGVTSLFASSKLSEWDSTFRFRRILAGTYTLSVFVPGRREVRQTIEVGPGTADASGRVRVTVKLVGPEESPSEVSRRLSISARALAIPDRAHHEYEEAQKDLARREVESAKAHLERAVEIAPQFALAWNNLGTMAYQTKRYERAEECFRAALTQDPALYEALVNLGGVLINLQKLEEAREWNQHAVLLRSGDALANAQLGITHFQLKQWDLAEKYLEAARRIDAAHFSHPQLLLAKIHTERQEPKRAADDLEDFLNHHPDWPQAETVRQTIEKLRGQ